MNIQPISKIYIPHINVNNNTYSNKKYSNLSPLSVDTVSFGVGEKHLVKGAKSITYDLAMQVVEEAKPDAQDLKFNLKKILSPFIASAKNPNAPIMPGERGIHVRVKSENSLRDKLTSRNITTMYGAKNVGDAIGGRIVLRSAAPKDVDNVIKAMAKGHKQGIFNIYEIEKWTPKVGKIYTDTRDLGYGTSKGLAELEDATGLKSKVGPQDSGYPAIHVGIKTKKGFKAEIQIMGVDVEELKDIEDLGYKIRCGKPIPDKYNPMNKTLLPAFEEIEAKGLEQDYMNYVNDAYLYALNFPAQKFNTRKKAPFIKIPYYLPQELDFTEMAKEMEKCRNVALAKSKVKPAKKN